MLATTETAGEAVAIRSDLHQVDAWLGPCTLPIGGERPSSISIRIEADRTPFETDGWDLVTHGVVARDGDVVMRDVCTSGFDVLARIASASAEFVFRRAPRSRSRLVNAAMPVRGRLLARSALLQYPALWWAATRGRAPVHAAAVESGGERLLLIGGSGLGKSTLIRREAAAGERPVADNLCVSDGRTVWGVVEPLRVEGGSGRRTSRGRREATLANRAPHLVPDRIVVLRRGVHTDASARPCAPATAARLLTGGTYLAGELRRFWPFAAALSVATSVGPVHPPVREVAETLADRCSCVELALPREPGPRLQEMLDQVVNACA